MLVSVKPKFDTVKFPCKLQLFALSFNTPFCILSMPKFIKSSILSGAFKNISKANEEYPALIALLNKGTNLNWISLSQHLTILIYTAH